MTSSQQRVFISYQRADEPFARQVREHLSAHGVLTWMDQYDIPVGAYWTDEVDKGLSQSDIVVGILSPDAVESRNVKNEWDWAIQNDKPLLLLQYRPCLIPHRYVSINFIDASGVEPAPAFDTLLQALGVAHDGHAESRLVQTDIAPQPISHGLRSGGTRRQQPFVIGREQEQQQLRERLAALAAGTGSLVLLAGEAGIGKTTLTDWLAWAAEQQGALVLTGGCYDLTTTPPYGPWGRLTSEWPDDPALPVLPVELRAGTGMGAIRNQTEFIEFFDDFLARAGVIRPLLLLLEDFHWADQASLDVLRGLARTVSGKRVLMVVTYRDDELTSRHPLAQIIPLLVRESGAERMTLFRLDPPAMRDLVVSRYRFTDHDTDLLGRYVYQLAEGNPFFTGEILRTLEEVGALQQTQGHWRLANLERVQVPTLVRQVIERRLDRLSDDARQLLHVGAVIGHEVPIDLWVEVSGAGEEHLSETLETATEARLVEEIHGGKEFRFTHALIRETLYEGMVSLRRRRWHRAVAEVLERASRPDPDLVSHHFQQATDPRAYDWLVRAGHRAMATFAYRVAADRWESAAMLLDGNVDRLRDLGWLQFQMGTLLRYASQQRSHEHLEEAQRIGQETRDNLLIASARAGLGYHLLQTGRLDQGLDQLQTGVLQLDEIEPDQWNTLPTVIQPGFLREMLENRRTMSVNGLAVVGRCAEALQLSEALLTRAAGRAAAGLYSCEGNIYLGQGIAYAALGQPDEAVDALARTRSYFESTAISPYVVGVGAFFLVHAVWIQYWVDRVEELHLVAEEGVEAWINARDTAAEGSSPRIAMIGVLLVHGDWTEARELAEASIIGEQMMGIRDESVRVLGVLSRNRGDVPQAWEQVARYFPDGPDVEPGGCVFTGATAMQRLAAELSIDTLDLTSAHAWLTAHDRWLAWSSASFGLAEGALLWARYYRAAEDRTQARQSADRAIELASSPRQPLALIAALRLRGQLAMDEHDALVAESHLTQALDLADACHAPFERALTLLVLAELDIAQSREDAARMKLADVRAICEPLEARPALERVAALEQRLAGVA